MLLILLYSASPPRAAAEAARELDNLAPSAEAFASSVRDKRFGPDKAIDGVVSDASRWMSRDLAGPHTLELRFPASFEFGSAHIYSGWKDCGAAENFVLQSWQAGRWRDIPGARVEHNYQAALRVVFDEPVATTRIRLVCPDDGFVKLKELMLFGPTPGGGPPLTVDPKAAPASEPPDTSRHHVLANQTGYNAAWSKRFTAPVSPDGTSFRVVGVDSGRVFYEGVIENQIGDFSSMSSQPEELVIEVEGGDQSPGRSFPFAIRPLHTESIALEPALRFMADCRSIVGTHPSAYGGHPWRDGTYYTYETPSLILMYLAHPSFFESLPVEIDYRADRAKALDPNFQMVRQLYDDDALESVRSYYTEVDPPVGDRVPDLIQLVHWGIGYQLVDPDNGDPSGDKRGVKIHAQTVEQFAYFLYAYPYFKQYFSDDFYQRVYEFAFDQWRRVGLLNRLTEVGEFKGREGPGHSIAPNLMMYEVARRHGRADADHYLEAAVRQAEWHVTQLDPSDPRVTRGQRLSEHPAMTGLLLLQRQHPEHAPRELGAWLDDWVGVVIDRSDNLYDFRKFSDQLWTLPAPWSDPGSVAGFPALSVAVKSMIDDPSQQERLDQLKASHFDALFGRNPVNAASSNKAEAYPGIDRGWPYKYGEDICARLELCRGVLNTAAAHEHYPFNPNAKFRHPEGWSGFNAAFNVSLAYCCWEDCRVELRDAEGASLASVGVDGPLRVAVRAPRGFACSCPGELSVEVAVDGLSAGDLALSDYDEASGEFHGKTSLKELAIKPGQGVAFSYGFGLFRKQQSLRFDEASQRWVAGGGADLR